MSVEMENSFKQAGSELGSDPITSVPEKVIQEDIDKNIYTVMKGENGKSLALEALDDLIIIVEDRFRTGFECKTCDGNQHTNIKCSACSGTGVEPVIDESTQDRYPCRRCGKSAHVGFNPCVDCKGTGGLLIAPDIAKRRPTTGIITSVGKRVKENGVLLPGKRVMYSLFAGTAIAFKQQIQVRIMHEHEVMCILHGSLKIGDTVR